ncbi:MAG: hypothetical protein ABL887_04465 [Nitrosomonas sp.]
MPPSGAYPSRRSAARPLDFQRFNTEQIRVRAAVGHAEPPMLTR